MESLHRLRRTLAVIAAVALFGGTAEPAAAQGTGTIQGQVVDATSLRPLADAQISVAGTGIGMLTNNAGRFLLLNVPAGQVRVQALLIGFESAEQTVTVQPGQTAIVDFQLASTAIALGEVVVTGQGQATERRRLATTVEVIGSTEISAAPVQSLDQLLQGRVAGATVNASSGQPGTGSLVSFRGTSSVFGSQTPVIYVDGVRVDNDQSTADGTGGEQSSALAELLTSDVDRIEITKGGAASTLYGSDAATGVIQIFTKRGTPGAPRVTARVEQGFDAPELKYIFDVRTTFPDIVADGGAPGDLLEKQYFKTGHFQNYYMGVSGGTADFTYNVSGRIQDAEGAQVKNESTLYAVRGGLQAQVSERLSVDFSGSYTRTDFDRVFNGSAIADPLTTFEVGDALFFSGEETLQEALETFLLPDITEVVSRFIFGLGASYTASDYVSARLNLGVDNRSSQQRILEPIGFTPGEVEGELTRYQREFSSVSMDLAATLNYPNTGTVTSAFTVGAQGFRDDESIVDATGTSFALPGAPDIDEAADITAFETNSELFNGGIYFSEQLGFWDKLFVNGGVRLDAGSTFGEEVDFQTYPKLGGSYLLSQEDFFQDRVGSWVDDLKLRVAYGKTGRFPQPFLRDRSFNAVSFRGESAPRFDNPGNENLAPEVTATIEAGSDLALFNNRVGISYTYYQATTTDALFDVPEQPVTGEGDQLRNVGEITNSGHELEVSVQLVNTRDFAWSLGGTLQTNKNRVTDMGTAAAFFPDDQKHVCGPPLDCDPDKPGLEELPIGAWYVTTPVDTNGDGLNDGSERRYTGGQPTPTKSGSIYTNVTLFNNLTLSALADWAGGHDVFDWGSVWATFNAIYRRELIECGQLSDNPPPLSECGVAFPVRYNTDGTERGKYSQSAARSAFLYDGDWFKLRELSARYAMPESWTNALGVERGSLFGSVRNVWVWSRNELVDPELSGMNFADNGLELGSETSITPSPPRQFRFGVEVVF